MGSSLAERSSGVDNTQLPTGDFARADRAAYELQQSIVQSDAIQGRRLYEITATNAQDNFRARERDYTQELETARQVNGLDLPSDYAFPNTAMSAAAMARGEKMLGAMSPQVIAGVAPARPSKPQYLSQSEITRENYLLGGRGGNGGDTTPYDTRLESNRFANARRGIMPAQARMAELALLGMQGDAVRGMPASYWDAKAQEYKDTTIELGQRFARDGIYNGFKANAILARQSVTDEDTNHMVSVLIDSGGAAAVGTALGTRSAGHINGPLLGVPTNGPSFKSGASDGGPGTWGVNKVNMSEADRAYQLKITGAPSDIEYRVTTDRMVSGEKWFDGYDPIAKRLIDAKRWESWPKENLPFSMADAKQQLQISNVIARDNKMVVQVVVANEAKAALLQQIVTQNRLRNTVVVHVPK